MSSNLFRRKNIEAIRAELDSSEGESGLHRNLNLFDLVCFGIAAIVGAGIFSTIGTAAADGGPAVSLLFVLTAITCLFSALCYAESPPACQLVVALTPMLTQPSANWWLGSSAGHCSWSMPSVIAQWLSLGRNTFRACLKA